MTNIHLTAQEVISHYDNCDWLMLHESDAMAIAIDVDADTEEIPLEDKILKHITFYYKDAEMHYE